MATQTTLGSTVRNNGGTILNAGNVAGDTVTGITQIANNTAKVSTVGRPQAHVEGIFKGNAVSITSITQSSSTGFCLITKSSHGLALGDILAVYGTDIAGYNVTHVVTVVVNANTVQTSVRYSSNTATHGNYKVIARNFNKMVANEYIGTVIGAKIAGTATNVMRITGADAGYVPIPTYRGYRRYNITSWNNLTGAATKGGSAGALVQLHDIANNTDIAYEPLPTRAVPGELVYRDGSPTPELDDYSVKTG